jgi:hypothetical protein
MAPAGCRQRSVVMTKYLMLLAALVTLGACALTDGGAGDSPITNEHVCQTGGRGCG